MLKRLILSVLVLIILGAAGLYFFNQYWIHRFDPLIARQAEVYRLDPDLVWSIIYEETYFSPWKRGEAGEIGLMQVTPTVGREWAAETGMRELARQMESDPASALREPERNIQVGCWYLEKILKDYRDTPDSIVRIVAAYNAGPSRAAEWNKRRAGEPHLTAEEFIARITIPSTRIYVSNILARYRRLKESKQKAVSGKQKAKSVWPSANDGRRARHDIKAKGRQSFLFSLLTAHRSPLTSRGVRR
ncbi:MAG TPA: transglycosylase SLT domain-containing protein [Pyrinomonadaceae bacterium]|jgi:soluble lytic murein transglycosylase